MQEIADCVKGMSTPPQFHPSHLDDIVDAVLRTLKPTADEKGVHVVARGADSLPNIDADEHRLFNALYNLLNNAIMDTDSGGTVTIQVQLAGDNHVVISIRDTGHGMPPEVLKSLFSDKAISRKAGGTGLGTKIVKDIVNAHCGSVWAESELGKGTSVYVMLPLLQGGI
jgi:signal transduction histidine kinase